MRENGIEDWTILRPPFFMSNLLLPSVNSYFPSLVAPIRRLRTALPPGKRMMLLDPDDIGRVVARVVEEPGRFSKRAMDVGGEALTSG